MIVRVVLFCIVLLAHACSLYSGESPKGRYISIAPATTEILFALGIDEEIVGVSTQCNHPAQAQTKEKVGTFSDPNIEKILSLHPSIVFATGLEQAPAVNRLRQLGVTVYENDPVTIEALFSSIEDIGKKTGRSAESQALIRSMRQRLDRVRAKVRQTLESQRKKVFIEIWHDPLLTAGKGSLVDDIVIAAGGVNVADDTPRPYSYFSGEQVIARDPEYIFLGHHQGDFSSSAAVYRRAGWQKIRAVKDRRVFDVDPDILLRPGPRILDAVEAIHNKLFGS